MPGAAIEVKGMVRIEVRDPLQRNSTVIYEGRTEQTSRSTTPSEQVPFHIGIGGKRVMVHEDGYIVLMFKPDSAETLEKASSTVSVDITQYQKVNGQLVQPFPSTLTQNDLFSNNTVAVAAGQWNEIGKVQVPAGAVFECGQGSHGSLSDSTGRLYIKLQDEAAD